MGEYVSKYLEIKLDKNRTEHNRKNDTSRYLLGGGGGGGGGDRFLPDKTR